MVTFTNFCLFMVFMINSALLVNKGHSQYIPKPSNGPSNDNSYVPSPLSTYEKYLSNCSRKTYLNCGDEIFFSVVFGNRTVSNDCCVNLITNVGKQCHDDMTKFIVTLPKFESNKLQIFQRNNKVWNNCVPLLIHSPQPING